MTHTYQLTGMTCGSCESKVKSDLLSLPEITSAIVSKEHSSAVITMDKHISLNALQSAIGGPNSKYQIAAVQHSENAEQAKGWIQTYKPLLLIFLYLTGVSFIAANAAADNRIMHFMNYFMGGFFIVFSFFKLLDLKGFADSYSMYDIIAMKLKTYGFIYPFIELLLGVSYLLSFEPAVTNIAVIIVMGVSSIGVIKSVIRRQKIQCACLGAVFNLPMSTVTIVEDLLMAGMAITALILKM